MGAAAVIMTRRKRLIRRFREAGATRPDRAVALETLGERRTWIFNQMVRCGVFLPASDGRFFMDEQAATEFLHRMRMRAIMGAGILLLALLIVWALGLVSSLLSR
jgi:hypothetical protein